MDPPKNDSQEVGNQEEGRDTDLDEPAVLTDFKSQENIDCFQEKRRNRAGLLSVPSPKKCRRFPAKTVRHMQPST